MLDGAWVLESGRYLVEVGASSRDLRGAASVEIAGNEPTRPLTLESTLAEVMAVPAAAAVAGQALGSVLGDGEVDPDMARMFAEIPAFALAGFTGIGTAKIQALLDEANRAAGL